MIELKPCPFCGSHKVGVECRYEYDSNGPDYTYPAVQCECGARSGEGSYNHLATIAEINREADYARNKWNTRTPDTSTKPLEPDMPAQELLLHMGELTLNEMLVARAAIRWANSHYKKQLTD